ncbi:MAG: helix-hairpin-helix domain-containing protein, partial [Haloferacaceae archaeon]
DAESDNGGETDAESETDTDESELDSIRGLGPTYINRLREAGIETREDLRRADVAEVAEAADVAPSRADDWKRQVS